MSLNKILNEIIYLAETPVNFEFKIFVDIHLNYQYTKGAYDLLNSQNVFSTL